MWPLEQATCKGVCQAMSGAHLDNGCKALKEENERRKKKSKKKEEEERKKKKKLEKFSCQ